jgi:hypothetical protein
MADDLVTIKTCLTIAEAESARLGLELEGIDATIADANIVTADWFLGNAVGYIKINVPTSQVERALEVLARHQRAAGPEGSPSDEMEDLCLGCGAEMPDEDDTCLACGWTYGPPEEETSPEE